MQELQLRRTRQKFLPDSSRVITRFFGPGGEERKKKLINKVLSLSEEQSNEVLEFVLDDFSGRHADLESSLLMHYSRIEYLVENPSALTKGQKLLLGAYFTKEYSIESVAFLNPSIIEHPRQDDLQAGSTRYIFSFRAIGEGHISSIVFRSGIINEKNQIIMGPTSPFVETPQVSLNPIYDKSEFLLTLKDVHSNNVVCERIFETLPDKFRFSQLKGRIRIVQAETPDSITKRETIEMIFWIARSNYEQSFRVQSRLSERVIFPTARNESNGIEDARFVRLVDDGGDMRYYATYTAYNGRNILPMMLQTRDFLKFKMFSLNGPAIKDKGMALFPRKIGSKYVMLGRQDGQNLYIMSSDNLEFWRNKEILQTPEQPWEFIQIGNCGSPLETEKGWLLLTHGVGPMRKYCIGVDLLDLDDPLRIIGKLQHPLIMPNEYEREGYVPNVVYTCGAAIHNEMLVIPYALSDSISGIAAIELKLLFDKLLQHRH